MKHELRRDVGVTDKDVSTAKLVFRTHNILDTFKGRFLSKGK